jgi:hypothetical protein
MSTIPPKKVLTFDDVTENQLLCLSFTEKYNLKATFIPFQYIGKADLWNQEKKIMSVQDLKSLVLE